MRVKDIMTKPVVTIPRETSVEDAARMMRDNRIGLLPIGDKENVFGVITDRDIAVRVTAEGLDAKHTPVREVMSKLPFYCFDDLDVEDACFMMEEKHVRRLLVFDRSRDLVGVLSLDDEATRTTKEKLTGHALSKVAKMAHV
jgi:CBS domain-containing protein